MDCRGCRYYKNLADNHCIGCDGSGYTKPSNGDRIRAMSDEELAVLLEGCICPKDPCPDIDRDTPTDKKHCTKCWLEWLKQEATT